EFAALPRERRRGPHPARHARGGGDHRRRDPGRDHEISPVGLPVARVVHHGGPQKTRHHVHDPRHRDAAARFFRRDHDALPTGLRLRAAHGLPAAAALRPDLLRARRDHDLLRRHDLHRRPDELHHAAADWLARRRVSVPQQFEFLVHLRRRDPVHGVAVPRRLLDGRLARLSARIRIAARPRRRLLHLGPAGVGTLLTGINFVVTILKMRAPGMTLMKMPVFTWTALATSGLIIATFPVLTATLFLLGLDRYVGTHFFTDGFGGNLMMYINLIWIWGHPEGYILILPLFGVFSEIVPTFSGKPLFAYSSMVYATIAIMILSYLVWLHHFFTMGSGADVNSFFSLTTMMIAIPTGVKIFNWLFTMYRGRVRYTVPMLWAMGFLFTFTIGGMTGVMLSVT